MPGWKNTQASGLTGHQEEVMELLAQGLTNKQIAKLLFVQPGTVNNTVTDIRKRVFPQVEEECDTRVRLVLWWINRGNNGQE